MNTHKNARTTPHGRALMVQRVLKQGRSPKSVATDFGVSERTVYKWLARFRAEGMAGLENRPSRARRLAHRLPEPWVALILRLRRDYRMTALEIAQRLHVARSTVAGVLARHGLGRLKPLEPRAPARRYEYAAPGELLHLDVKKLARFWRIGHRITGDRRGGSDGAGWDFVHVCVDDYSRLAYVEVLPDERRETTTGFLVRALRWFRAKGVTVRRIMTDNGCGYVSRLFAKACRITGLRHIRTRPYTPRTNGKAERFIQTLLREWAYALPYPSSQQRNADLPRWLRYYNHERPHGSLAMKPPISRLMPAH
ncbi:MAG: IS481 family transposase [Candidatus Methylomirabilia bacterium]